MEDLTPTQLGKALNLLTDVLLIFEPKKQSPILQKRINEFIQEIGEEKAIELMRLANGIYNDETSS